MMSNSSLKSKGYHLGTNQPRRPSYTYAASITPSISEIETVCEVCGNDRWSTGRYPKVSFSATLDGGRKYPDTLLCGAYPLFVVSERVIDDWVQSDIKGFQAFPFNAVPGKNQKTNKDSCPQYYHLEITGRCDLDLEAMGVTVEEFCPECGYSQVIPWFDHPFIVRATDGTDIFVNELFPFVVFCNEKLMNLIFLNRHTNFKFENPEDYWDAEKEFAVT